MRHPDGRDTTYPLFLQESQGLKSDFRMREIIMQGTASLLLTLSIISLLTCHRNKKKITQIQNLSGSGQPEMDIYHDFYGNYILHMVGGGVKNSSLGRRPISYIPLDSVFPLQGLTQVYCWLDFPTPYLNLHTPQLIAV